MMADLKAETRGDQKAVHLGVNLAVHLELSSVESWAEWMASNLAEN